MKFPFSWVNSALDYFSQSKRKLRKIQRQTHLDKTLVSSLNKSKFPSFKQFKYLPKILNPKEKKRAGFFSAIILICLVALAGRLYFGLTVSVASDGGDYSEALVGAPRFINPILAQTNDVDMDIAKLVFSGLLKLNKKGQAVPDLAENFEISADQLTYTFFLRKDVKWHDNEPFKADDVIFTVASIQDPEFKSPLSRSFRGVVAEKVDDFTVKFTLKEPFAPFLSLLTFGILPEHLWYNVSAANADLAELNKQPVGTGSWQFESFKKDKAGNIKSYTLAKNKNYYGDKPHLDKIIFKFYGDFISAIDALKSKSVQAISYLPKEYKADLKKYKNLNYHNLEQPQYTAVFFNQSKNTLLQADYVRQALALATDKQKIISEAFGQEGRIIDSPSLPGITENPDIKKYAYDPEAAVAMLEKNGWQLSATTTPDGVTQQVRMKKGFVLSVILTTVDQPENVKTAEIIKQLWEQIGVKTDLNIVDKSKIIQDVIRNRDYEALLFAENIGADPDPFPFWHSSQNEYPGLNLALFSNKTADKLLEDGRKTSNWDERQKDYLEFQKIVANALPAIFLFNTTYTYPQDKAIKGFDVSGISVPADRFININEWYVNSKRVWK